MWFMFHLYVLFIINKFWIFIKDVQLQTVAGRAAELQKYSFWIDGSD